MLKLITSVAVPKFVVIVVRRSSPTYKSSVGAAAGGASGGAAAAVTRTVACVTRTVNGTGQRGPLRAFVTFFCSL